MTKGTTRSKKTSATGKSKTASAKSVSAKTRVKTAVKAHRKTAAHDKPRTGTAIDNRVKVRTDVSPFDPLMTKVTASPLSCERFIDETEERVMVSSDLTNLVRDVPDSFIEDSDSHEIFEINRNTVVGVIDGPETAEIDHGGFDSILRENTFRTISSKSGIIDKITSGITRVASGNFSGPKPEDTGSIFDRRILAKIAGYAAREIEGVMPNKKGVVNGLVNAIRRSIDGIRVEVGRTEAVVDMAITVKYGADIPEIVSRLRETVASRINEMTGLKVVEVNIKINDIAQP